MGTTGQILYIKGDKNKEVTKSDVLLGDILSMECADQTIVNRLKPVRLLKANGQGQKRYVVSILEVIAKIHEVCPNLTVENLGETDLIVTIEEQKKQKKVVQAVKSFFVLLVTFIGAGFSIMSFNNDVDVTRLFSQIHELATGAESSGFTILEISYSVGLTVGILVFFNHFGKKKFTVDPTPMEIQMRLYENDIQTTLVENASRRGDEIDVDNADTSGSSRT